VQLWSAMLHGKLPRMEGSLRGVGGSAFPDPDGFSQSEV
jgi:hypothetical protein